MILKGFKFGMILQFAVGPVCLFIFNTALSSGAPVALLGVAGVTLVDGAYIAAAILGLGAVLNKNKNARVFIKTFGALVLVTFGATTVLGVFGVNLLPSLSFAGVQTVENVFLKTMLLTLSNPLTILFWAGVFSSKVVEEGLNKKGMYAFGLGALLATVTFLSSVALAGHFMTAFVNEDIMKGLNLAVGGILIWFGIRSYLKR